MKILGNDWAGRRERIVLWIGRKGIVRGLFALKSTMSFQKYFFGIKTYTEKRLQQSSRLLS